METKMLDLHEEKSCFIVFGKGKPLEKLNNELKETPLTLYGQKMIQKKKEKYLDLDGDHKETVDSILNRLDINGNGSICYAEFCIACTDLKKEFK